MKITNISKGNPPVATKIKKELTIHGNTRIDNYYWMNQREDADVLSYLEAENRYAKNVMSKTEPLQDKIYNEIVGRIKKADLSVPCKEGSYYYYSRYEEGGEYPIHCREKETNSLDLTMDILNSMEQKKIRSNEEILLDVNKMADGFDYFNVSGVEVSADENILAYGVDNVGRREYTIYFLDLKNGKLFEETIPKTSGSVTWANDNKTVFYTIKDEALRECKIFKHRLGTNPSEDVEIYYEEDDAFHTFIYKTKSKKYLIIGSSSTMSSEYNKQDIDFPFSCFINVICRGPFYINAICIYLRILVSNTI